MNAAGARFRINAQPSVSMPGREAFALFSLIGMARRSIATETSQLSEPKRGHRPTSDQEDGEPRRRIDTRVTWRSPIPRTDAMWLPASFQWTPHRNYGPGAELLGELHGRRIIDLGCGTGDNIAHLAFHGATVTGVDHAPTQIVQAVRRWSWLVPPKDLICVDALDYLDTTAMDFDCCFSALGAVGQCPTDLLLAAIWRRLRPGGVLAFSVPHVDRQESDGVPTTPGSTAMATTYRASLAIWYELVTESGFTVTYAADLADPSSPDEAGSTIVTALRN